MFAANTTVGALTNLESWLIFQRGVDGSDVMVTKLSGKKANGNARGLDIMLGLSVEALGDDWLAEHRL